MGTSQEKLCSWSYVRAESAWLQEAFPFVFWQKLRMSTSGGNIVVRKPVLLAGKSSIYDLLTCDIFGNYRPVDRNLYFPSCYSWYSKILLKALLICSLLRCPAVRHLAFWKMA